LHNVRLDWVIFGHWADGLPIARIANTFCDHGWNDCFALLAHSWIGYKRQADSFCKLSRDGHGYRGVIAMKNVNWKKILVGLYLAYSVATDTIIWGGALYLLITGGF